MRVVLPAATSWARSAPSAAKDWSDFDSCESALTPSLPPPPQPAPKRATTTPSTSAPFRHTDTLHPSRLGADDLRPRGVGSRRLICSSFKASSSRCFERRAFSAPKRNFSFQSSILRQGEAMLPRHLLHGGFCFAMSDGTYRRPYSSLHYSKADKTPPGEQRESPDFSAGLSRACRLAKSLRAAYFLRTTSRALSATFLVTSFTLPLASSISPSRFRSSLSVSSPTAFLTRPLVLST